MWGDTVSFLSCYEQNPVLLMEGALGERLKREYRLLPHDTVAFADIIYRTSGKRALSELWGQYIAAAKACGLPFIATTPTRRANREQVINAGFDERIITDNIHFLKQIRDAAGCEMYIGGLMGCKGDAYKATDTLGPEKAEAFHHWQAALFKESGADFLFAGIMPALPEATGMARAMARAGLPYIISFMVRENGRLIDGTTIHDAIDTIDNSVPNKPVCYMTNCIHPDILYRAVSQPFNQTGLVKERLRGIQANTSALPPEQLDGSVELRCSDCKELAQSMARLAKILPLKIVGGCCGTDDTHIHEIAEQFKPV